MDVKNIAKLNPFRDEDFMNEREMKLRACIGDNSGTSRQFRDIHIAEGFKKAHELIYEGVKSDKIAVDVAVYPVFSCSRHSIELYLKLIIKQLLHIYKIKIGGDKIYGNIKKENSKLHSIKQLKNNLKSLFIVDPGCKKEFSANLKYFGFLIKDYYFNDRSTAFRYTHSNKIKHQSFG